MTLAADSNNNPYISYYHVSNEALKYAKKIDAGWLTYTIDSGNLIGWYTSIAIDANNNPHISYCDGANAGLKYAV